MVSQGVLVQQNFFLFLPDFPDFLKFLDLASPLPFRSFHKWHKNKNRSAQSINWSSNYALEFTAGLQTIRRERWGSSATKLPQANQYLTHAFTPQPPIHLISPSFPGIRNPVFIVQRMFLIQYIHQREDHQKSVSSKFRWKTDAKYEIFIT